MDSAPDIRPDFAPLENLLAADGLLDALPWGVLVLDEQRSIRRVNRQAAYWCGTTPEALLGCPLAEAALPPAASAALLWLLEVDEAASQEVFLPPVARWVAFMASRQPGGWVLYGQDITRQKRREQQYQTLADNTPDVLTRWGPDLRLRYANAALAAKFGLPPTALLHKTKQEMGLPEAVAGPYMAALRQVFDTGQPLELSHPLPTPQGVLTYHSRLVPELHNGRIDTVLGIAHDITGLQQTQAEALRLRDELTKRVADKYHALFQSMDQGFCVLEVLFDEAGQQAVDYRYLELNPAFAEQSGMPADAIGKSIRQLLPDLDPFWFTIFGQVVRAGASVRVEHYVPQLRRWFDAHAFPLGSPEARQVAVLFTDITARKRREAHLTFLAEASDDLMRLTNLDDTLNALGEKLAAHLDLSACAFAELVDDGQIGVIRHGWHRADVPSLLGTYRMAEFVAPEVLRLVRSGEPVVIRDVFADPLTDGEQYAALRIGSYVSMPLVRNEEWCFLLVSYRAEPYDWQEEEIALLRELTARIWTRLERARAEEALHQSQEQFRLFVTASSDVLYRMSADWQFLLSMNGRGFLADATTPNKSWLETHIPSADHATVGAAVRAAIAGPHFFELEHRIFRADGLVGWTFSRAVPVLNERGELLEWFGVATDVTARKQAEEALQQSMQQRALFEAVQVAQEVERKRMAETLHNGIGQLLYATKLRLDRLHRPPPSVSPELAVARREAEQLLGEAIRQTRALSHELVPLVLENFGLAAALQDIGRAMSTPQLSLRSHVLLDEAAAPLPVPLQMALYRIAQELALNIGRHAHGATAASLELETTPGWVLLRAEDNGPGFAAPAAASPGLGLRSIRDRVALLGGQLQSGNLPPGGAYVRIRIPLPIPPSHDTPLPG